MASAGGRSESPLREGVDRGLPRWSDGEATPDTKDTAHGTPRARLLHHKARTLRVIKTVAHHTQQREVCTVTREYTHTCSQRTFKLDHATSSTSLRLQVPCVVLRPCYSCLRIMTSRSYSQTGDKLFDAAIERLPGPLASALLFAELDDPCTLRFYPRWNYGDLIACKGCVVPSEFCAGSTVTDTGLVDTPMVDTGGAGITAGTGFPYFPVLYLFFFPFSSLRLLSGRLSFCTCFFFRFPLSSLLYCPCGAGVCGAAESSFSSESSAVAG